MPGKSPKTTGKDPPRGPQIDGFRSEEAHSYRPHQVGTTREAFRYHYEFAPKWPPWRCLPHSLNSMFSRSHIGYSCVPLPNTKTRLSYLSEQKCGIVVETPRNRPLSRSESVCAGLRAPPRAFLAWLRPVWGAELGPKSRTHWSLPQVMCTWAQRKYIHHQLVGVVGRAAPRETPG